MSNYITNSKQIEQEADIVKVVSNYLTLDSKNKCCCPFHEEDTPSFSVNPKTNTFKCFGCGEAGGSVVFVMKYEKVSYMEALERVADICNIPIQRENDYSSLQKEIVTYKTAKPEQEEGSYHFEIKESFSDYELKELFPHFKDDLPPDHKEKKRKKYIAKLKTMNFFALEKLVYIKNRKQIITSTHERFPIFLIDHGDFKKIYKPREKNKAYRFLYIGNKPKDYVNGYQQLIKAYEANNAKSKGNLEQYDENGDPITFVEEKLEEVIICSGERDSINVYAMGYHVVWLNSESAILSYSQYISLKKYAKKIYNLPDIDETGLREGHRLAMEYLDILTIRLPDSLKERKDFRGKYFKDVTDYLKSNSVYDFKQLFKNALPYQFWDEKPKIKNNKYLYSDYDINNVYVYNFLYHNGFCRYREEEDREDYIFIRHHNQIVQKVTSNDVKNFIHQFLENRMMDVRLRNAMYKTNQLNENSLSNLNYKSLNFQSYSKEHQLFFFKNKTVKVTANTIEEGKFSEIDNYVWSDNVLDHEMKIEEPSFNIEKDETGSFNLTINNKNGIFWQYIINTSRVFWQKETDLTPQETEEENLHIINKIYSIGYLLHKYKDASRPWAVFAMDHRISDDGESQGGSGKSIVLNTALRHMLRTFYINGKNKKNIENPHMYEGITKDTDYIIIDDCDRYVRFDIFFNIISGDLQVNPKGKQQYTLSFKDSPKLAFTSNFTPDKSDGSTQRRILYTVFSDYYHDNTNGEYERSFSPRDEFGIQLFTDFEYKEWNHFYNFMLQCLQTYLRFEKINPPMGNVMKRNLLQRMTDNFKSWADIYLLERLDTEIHRLVAFEDFKEKTKMTKFTTNRFIACVKAWCQFYGYKYNPDNLSNSQGRIIRKVEGKTVECIYIANVSETKEETEGEFKLKF